MANKVPDKIPEIKYKKILYTTDLSESGRHAFHHAVSLTRLYKAELTVFHVVEGGPELDRRLFGYIDNELWEDIKTRNLEEAKNILINRKRDNTVIKKCIGQFCEELKGSIAEDLTLKYSIEVKMGEPFEEIVKEAVDGKYDLIVMGFHGNGLIKNAMMGDTVRKVVKRSMVPVLVVKVP
ncbi:universal stress protein [bacterium]|nr:universal stress protein [bacterium]